MKRALLTFVLASTLNSFSQSQSSSTVTGRNNQSAGTNNGIMNQFNITVTPRVKETLKRRAEQDFGIDRGWLRTIVPANDQIVDDGECPVPKGDITVLLGIHGGKGSCSGEHCTIFRNAKRNATDSELLSLDRKDGSLQINAVLLDESGKVIAVVDNSRTHVNPNNAFDWSRPDSHTIDVTDQFNRHVLHIRFANPHTVIVTGIFSFSDGIVVTIKDDEMVEGSSHFSHFCSANNDRGAFSF